MRELFRRLAYLFNRRRLDRELVDEMAFHREMSAREGGGPVGNATRLREEAHAAWGWTWIDRLAQDVRYSARTILRSPMFSLSALTMLAVGIGVNVAAFGFINAAFLKPLPVRDPDTLLRFERRSLDRYASQVPFPAMAYIGERAQTLSAVLAVAPARLTLEGGGQPVKAHFVTANFFSELGAGARLGRLFGPADDRRHDSPAVVISSPFWQEQFASDPSILGRAIRLNDQTAVVIGVASAEFGGLSLDDPNMWLPLARHADIIRGSQLLTSFAEDSGVTMWGRMRPGVVAPQVEGELGSLLVALRTEHPRDVWENERLVSERAGGPGKGVGSRRGTGTPSTSKVGPILTMIAALALLILAVACGNLGSLLLARGVSRSGEISIRMAIGAGPSRLIRQLFTESLVLAALGAIAGLGVGQVGLKVLMSVSGGPAWLDLTPDWRVVAFTVGVAAVSAVLFGLAPALQVARQRRKSALIRQILVGGQVAASCVLLILAGLLVRALHSMTAEDPGFAYQQVIAISPDLSAHGYSPDQASAYLANLRHRLESLPGIGSVALASTPPLGTKTTVIRADIDGRQVDIHVNHVDRQFFETMGIRVHRGRVFDSLESQTMMVGESLARSAWPGKDPLGQTFEGRTIVGIVRSARQTALQDPDAVEAYFPVEPAVLPSMSVLIRTTSRPESSMPAVVAAVKAIDPDVFANIEMLETAFDRQREETTLTAAGVSLLGASALVLACIGIVGLVACAVAQRTKDIGIRIALGANGVQVVSNVLGQLVRPVVVGLMAGTATAAALSQLLRRELYGISSTDPIAYAVAIGVFSTTVALAAWWPARQALRIDPLRALRTT